MDHSRQRSFDLIAQTGAARPDRSKKNSTLLEAFDEVMEALESRCDSAAVRGRLRAHVLSSLVGLGRSTLTGMLCTQGRHQQDWSADYRLYSKQRLDGSALMEGVRLEAFALLKPGSDLVIGIDDTLLRKRGRHIPGVNYRRDPLGPAFGCNLVLGQRFLQLSVALPQSDGGARMIPIDWHHAPTAKKPSRKAPEPAWEEYRQMQKKLKLSQVAVDRIQRLRQQTPSDRRIQIVGDGGYTNQTLLKNLPAHVTFIGRTRKDAKLYFLPESQPLKGRKRRYGKEAPTPEQLRQDPNIPWERVQAFACGKIHDFKIKTLSPIRARIDGGKHDLRLVVIAPLAYRPKKGSPLLYRKPAYLLCTDPNLALEQILQSYLWRWDIEVNFRDEKTLLGVGEAQVRNTQSVQSLPQLQVAAYSMLLLASVKSFGTNGIPDCFPPPKWRAAKPPSRVSTARLINQLRYDLWASQIQPSHLSHFASNTRSTIKSDKFILNLADSLFHAAT